MPLQVLWQLSDAHSEPVTELVSRPGELLYSASVDGMVHEVSVADEPPPPEEDDEVEEVDLDDERIVASINTNDAGDYCVCLVLCCFHLSNTNIL